MSVEDAQNNAKIFSVVSRGDVSSNRQLGRQLATAAVAKCATFSCACLHWICGFDSRPIDSHVESVASIPSNVV
jgi:hypothetical protein